MDTRLNCKNIMTKVTNHGKTLEEVACENGFIMEEFLEKLEKGLGPKNYSAVLKADERNKKYRLSAEKKSVNMRKRQNQKEDENMKKKINPDEIKEVIQTVKDEMLHNKPYLLAVDLGVQEITEVDVMKKNAKKESVVKSDIEVLLQKENDAKKLMDSAKDAIKASESVLKVREKELEKIEKAYENAMQAVEDAKKDVTLKNAAAIEVADLLETVQEELEKLRNKEIYLVSPDYKGKLPEFGRFVSCSTIEGKDVEIETGTELMAEESLANCVECGYDSISEYRTALEFAKLCIKYFLASQQHKILVDSNQMKKVLASQSIEL